MSAHQLPEDLSRWPNDPYELLGIRHDVDPRALRRTYTELIRVYKPERYPEHFRRIREAYESVKRYAEFFGVCESQPPGPSPEVTPTDEPKPAPDVDPADSPQPQVIWRASQPPEQAEPTPIPPVRHDLHHELQKLWEQACSGQETVAYQRLRELHENHPGEGEIYVRLYWLLTLTPELDSQRSPADWLIVGLRANGLTGPMRELYRREIEDRPEEIMHPGCTDLLHSLTAPAELADLAAWRWRAAGRLEQWSVIRQDLDVLRPRILAADDLAWARLLLLAIDELAWVRTDPGLEWVRECWIREYCLEIETLRHLQIRLEYELDRLDFLLAVSEKWQILRNDPKLPALLPQLIRLSWNRPVAEYRPQLLLLLREIALRPLEFLEVFDGIRIQSAAVLAQFGTILTTFEQHQEDFTVDMRDAENINDLILEFLLENVSLQELFRKSLLNFCLQKNISPQYIAQLIQDNFYHLTENQHVSDMMNDYPLDYVYRATQMFWA